METSLHTFIDIFEAENAPVKKIVIPIIQRDYAQGRIGVDTNRVRTRFLDSLRKAVSGTPITLDFVYGDIDADGVLTPLDGQQRLTTLFLLHWYAAQKRRLSKEAYGFLSRFSYETRYSARDFCRELVDFSPSFTERLSSEIEDQPWFPLDWKKDPTIQSMLVMLDAINERFQDIEDLWQRLKDGAITFYFLPITDMGLTDELYIKMNSRGKPLTRFEHFKAELERELKAVDETVGKEIIRKIDLDWTDMLWQYRGGDNIIDDEFLRYFRFLCDILCYQSGSTPQGRVRDEFTLLREYFSADCPNVYANIEMLEAFFDCWCTLPEGKTPAEFLKRYFTKTPNPRKALVDSRYEVDIFADCLQYYPGRQFPLTRVVLLYAVLVYLLNQATISEKDFVRRLRIVNNLIQNSEDEISDSLQRNRMPADLCQIERIMKDGVIDQSIPLALNLHQLEEEATKLAWTEQNPALADALFTLEDHNLLYGQISIVGLEHPEHFSRFASLMECDWDLVNCALLTCGNYGQRERNGWRYQLGAKSNSEAWRVLFHKSANAGFEGTKTAMEKLLSQGEVFTNAVLSKIKDDYLIKCEDDALFDWCYYYIKYPLFRPDSYGKYSWMDYEHKPYEMSVMQTKQKWSENTYVPFLCAVDDKHLSREELGQYIVIDDRYIECQNDAYVIYDFETEDELSRVVICQNVDGIDIEDRILKMRGCYKEL